MATRTRLDGGLGGWENPRPTFAVVPVVDKPYTGGRLQRGAPLLGRRPVIKRGQSYPDPPKWWLGPLSEWIVYWYLVWKKKYEEGRDFYYQAPIFVPYLFQSRDFTRADFLIDLGPLSKAGQVGRYTAIVFDPITEFTHPDPQFDRDRRMELDKQGYLLIFMEGEMLQLSPSRVIEAGLRGEDLSNRN